MSIDFKRVKQRRERVRSVALARVRAHKEFDQVWRNGYMTRAKAYAWLAKEFGRSEVHIGWMTIAECARVVELVKKLFDENNF